MVTAAGLMDESLVSLQRALVGRYALERSLGCGGMGAVYLGRDLKLERPVAIKALPSESVASNERQTRFLREARTAANLQHPNIVPVYAVEELDDWIVIAMAYIDGGTLADLIRRRGALPPQDVIRIARDVSLALAYAHRRGVVHRDIKPENILLDSDSGRAMVTDFGIAHVAAGTAITDEGLLLGTPSYMSPEQASGSPLDGRSDLYSLGIVMHLCLTGRLPFIGEDSRSVLAQHVTRPAPPVATVAHGIPPALAQVVDRCLAKSAADRMQTGEDVAAALDASIERTSALPPALRAWVAAPGELTFSQAAAVPLLVFGVSYLIGSLVNPIWFFPGPEVFDAEAASLVGFVLPLPLYLIRRAHLLRRARAAGYGVSDLREALESNVEETEGAASGRLRLATPLQILLLGATTAYITSLIVPRLTSTAGAAEIAFFTYLVLLSAGALAEGIYGLVRRGERLSDKLRRAFWNSRAGNLMSKVAGAVLGGRQRAPAFGNRPTELALGSAAVVLYNALPDAQRKSLSDLPKAIEELQALAHRERESIAALDHAEAQALGPASHRPDNEGLSRRRDLAAREIHEARARAQKRLHHAVTALEMFRLDLLRLHASGNDADSITADLKNALDLSQHMRQEADALDEVQQLTAHPSPLRQST